MAVSLPLARTLWPGVASVTSGTLALLTLALVARYRGPAEFASFAVVWGCFFGVGGCLSGYQQELTRSIGRGGSGCAGGPQLRLRTASLVLGAPIAVIAGALVTVIGEGGDTTWATGLTIACGVIGLSFMVQINGVLVARDHWASMAAVVIADAFLRGVAIWVAVALLDGRGLAIAVVIGVVAWVPLATRSNFREAWAALASTSLVSFAPRALAAMLSAGCAALIIAGFPFLFALFRGTGLRPQDGVYLAALTLIRSPLLLIAYAYRPVVLKLFLASPDPAHKMLRLMTVWIPVGSALSLATGFVGPWVVRLIAGDEFELRASDAALMMAGSVLLVMLIASGVALVVVGEHAWSTAGWLLALGSTCAFLALVSNSRTEILGAGLAGPLAGLACHGLGLVRNRRHRALTSVET